MSEFKLLIHGAKQIVQVVDNGQLVRKGKEMQNVAILEDDGASGLSLLVNSAGLIEDIGTDHEVAARHPNLTVKTRINAKDKCVLPGLVDAHTHPVWEGDRVHEFAMKLAGATYMEVHKAGGGIHYTVERTRKASEDELFLGLEKRLNAMLRAGTTLVECKSGYGLDADNEIKMLKVIEKAKRTLPIDISSTFCGAHAVPKGMTNKEALQDVLGNQFPRVHKAMKTGELTVDNVDVFCEQGVFDTDQSRQILQMGQEMGLQLNFHGDELHPTGSAELAEIDHMARDVTSLGEVLYSHVEFQFKMGASLSAHAISHLEEITDAGIDAMAQSGSVGVVLPTTAYILRLTPPPVRKMIERGMAVALGSDFNPNAYCLSMPLVMHLACVTLRMSMPEALNASTINAAAALGKADTHGSLEKGKCGNIVILNAGRWEHLIYRLGCHEDVVKTVIHQGNIVFNKTTA